MRWTQWKVGVVVLVVVLAVTGSGCASFEASWKQAQRKYLTGDPSGRPDTGEPLPPPPTATVLQGPAPCPDSIARDAPLEQDEGARLHAGNWVPSPQLTDLGFTPGPEASEQFTLELPLTGQRVVALGMARQKGAGLVLLRPLAAGGYCVINHWASFQADPVDYALAGSWTAQDGRLSVLLLKMKIAPGSAQERLHWIAVGTDGNRAWYALGEGAQAHLLAPSAKLVPSGKALYLEVMLTRTARFRLGKDGRFVTH
jgi:hypothetical protein